VTTKKFAAELKWEC